MDDYWEDKRWRFDTNQPSLEQNSGWQSAIAGIFSINNFFSFFWLSCLVTVAWYIIPGVRHFPSSGHALHFLQLQVVCAGSWGLILLMVDLLWL